MESIIIDQWIRFIITICNTTSNQKVEVGDMVEAGTYIQVQLVQFFGDHLH